MKKAPLSGIGGDPGGEPPEDACKLCGNKEDTLHLMFECEKYSEPLWAVVGNVLKETVNRESNGEENLSNRLHAFLVLYNVTAGIPTKYVKNIMALIQEIKRNIILCRFKRETSDTGVTNFGRRSLYAHLSITVEKIRC
jgi:hypothetical protein